MNLVIIKNNLKEALGVVERATSENANLPILKNVWLGGVGGAIRLVATNLEIAISTTVPGKVIEEGNITVPAAVLRELVSNLPSERVSLEVKGGGLSIQTDNYHATIQGLPTEDFPIVPKIKDGNQYVRMKSGPLKDALTQVVVSAQFSELRPELNSVLWDFKIDEIKIAATDSFRLSEKSIPAGQFETNQTESSRMLIPLRTAQELTRILPEDEEVEIKKDASQVLFRTEQTELISRLVDGNFPDYGAIVPKDFETQVSLSRQELLNALRLAGVFSSRVNEVRIRIPENKKNIEVFSVDQTVGENNYLLPAKIQGKAREISFNWRYLTDGLKAIKTDEVFWGLNEENRPALLKSPKEASYFYVLMPILKA
ncbi:MAG: polymerase III subunit beta protein [Parcubacteria group bacterium GW2011_GWA1_59_11]|nr:MAG: polymerase III subunit beta protein [Parcubacteria group bacterium GW2011_GWA1_59_11]